MKATIAFIFFMLFLAGIAFVNLRGMQEMREERPVTMDDLLVSAWQPVRLGEMQLPDDTDMFLQFDANGQVSGHGGCNRFTGAYEFGAAALRLGPLAATRMACPEPAASFEISLLDALQTATTTTISANLLTMRNDRGHAVLRMTSIERK